MKSIEEIRINILVEPFFINALLYIFKAKSITYHKNQEFINFLPLEIKNDIIYRKYINWRKLRFFQKTLYSFKLALLSKEASSIYIFSLLNYLQGSDVH